MLLTRMVAVLALSQTALSFFMWFPDYRCIEDHTCAATESKRSEKNSAERDGGITLELVQRISKSDTPHDVKVRRLANRLARKYQRGPQVRQWAERETPTKRGESNDYSILTAALPTQTNSAPIDQDGTDFSYFTEVSLGTSKIPYYMLLDTGAGQTWIMGNTCTSSPCKEHNTFGPEESTTYQALSTDFNVGYGTGNVAGMQAIDDISIAGMKLSLTFGVANTTSIDFINFPFDGILGLNRATYTFPSFLQAVKTSKALKSNLFGVSLNRAKDGPNTGAINFGGIDTSRFSGDLSYTTVSSKTSNWAIPIDDMGVGNKKSGISGTLAYIDTGTSFIFGPPDDAKTFHALIPGSSSNDGVTYYVPCTTTDSAFFTFSGVIYEISSADWVGPEVDGSCTSNVYGMPVISGAWLLGDTFLKNVYSVFDLDQNRVGFAKVKGASSVTSSATTSSPTGSSSVNPSNTAEAVTATDSSSPTGSPGLNGHQTDISTGTAESLSSSSSTPSPTHQSNAARNTAGFLAATLASLALTYLVL